MQPQGESKRLHRVNRFHLMQGWALKPALVEPWQELSKPTEEAKMLGLASAVGRFFSLHRWRGRGDEAGGAGSCLQVEWNHGIQDRVPLTTTRSLQAKYGALSDSPESAF